MCALLRLAHHHLIDFIDWEQGPGMARMAGLTAATALTPRATRTLRLGRIARWGAGSIPCSLVQLFLQRAALLL